MGTSERREAVGYLKGEYEMSERRACRAVEITRRVFRYVSRYKSDAAVTEALGKLAREHPDLGFGKFYDLLRAQGHGWNHKRVHRVYCAMRLNKRRRHKRRIPARHPEPLAVPDTVNHCWSADFMSDALGDGRRFRTFNVVDDHRREVLAIEVDLNIGSSRVIRVLDRIVEVRGLPRRGSDSITDRSSLP